MQLSNEEIKEAIVEWAAKKGVETRAEDIVFESEDFEDDETDEEWTEVTATAKDVRIVGAAGGPYR